MTHLSPLLKTVFTTLVLPAVTLLSVPALAAERVYISYGLLERSVSVDSLERYAREGVIEADLLAYARYATAQQLEEVRSVLLTRADVSPVAVAQFLYTAQGEALLERIGEVIQTDSHQSGFYSLRSALILSADDDEEGLTPLNVLRKFPAYGIRFDVERTLQIVQELEGLINQTNAAIATIEQEFTMEIAANPLSPATQRTDLRMPGAFSWQKETLFLKDRTRERSFPADIYLPLTSRGQAPPTPAPVIIISHGLGSDRSAYRYLAEHLASYGFAVAIPEHPGSNSDQLQALIEGRANEVTQPAEFVDRPLDIKFLLDDLERRVRFNPRFRSRLDLQQVGVVGQSFGGYTAMALAGAEINFVELQKDCAENNSFNLSLLLQCRALELTQPLPAVQDDRIKAIIPINPIGSSILGEAGFSSIRLPVMIISGNADTVAPSLLEQIRPFTWLTVPNKYLLLLRGTTHFSTLGEAMSGDRVVDLPAEIVGPDRALVRRYLNATSVAFFKTYVANDRTFLPYLDAAYMGSISQPPVPLRLVRSLTADQLAQGLDTWRRQHSN